MPAMITGPLLRRADGQVEPAIRVGELEVTPAARIATLKGAALDLTAREYQLLETLVRHPGRAYSREQLEEALYGWDQEVASNAVEVHIHHLRHKLGPGWIRTLRGIGYAINRPDGPVA
jgi:two-component system response regulator QseB